jgi:hypothetical protein
LNSVKIEAVSHRDGNQSANDGKSWVLRFPLFSLKAAGFMLFLLVSFSF